jgi:hypothetical protein
VTLEAVLNTEYMWMDSTVLRAVGVEGLLGVVPHHVLPVLAPVRPVDHEQVLEAVGAQLLDLGTIPERRCVRAVSSDAATRLTASSWPKLPEATRDVLLEVLIHGPLSRAEIAARLRLSRPTLTRVTRSLVAQGLLVEGDTRPRAPAGRPSETLHVRDPPVPRREADRRTALHHGHRPDRHHRRDGRGAVAVPRPGRGGRPDRRRGAQVPGRHRHRRDARRAAAADRPPSYDEAPDLIELDVRPSDFTEWARSGAALAIKETITGAITERPGNTRRR